MCVKLSILVFRQPIHSINDTSLSKEEFIFISKGAPASVSFSQAAGDFSVALP